MSYSLITNQPTKCLHMVQEKQSSDRFDSSCRCEGQCAHHSSCHRKRLRRVILFTLASMMTVAFLLCLSMGDDIASGLGLLKRQSNGTTNNGQSIFVRNKRTFLDPV